MSDDAAAWAALREAEQHIGGFRPKEALECCDRAIASLRGLPAPAVRAVAVYLRAIHDFEKPPDAAALLGVKDDLIAQGQWEAASGAHSALAADAVRRSDWAAARGYYATAIGCAEAAGGRWIPSNLMRKLALAEIQAGHAAYAVGLLDHALQTLKSVALLNARLVEAECVEALGDAHAALGERARAEECWRDAAARQDRLDRGNAAAKVRAKLSAS